MRRPHLAVASVVVLASIVAAGCGGGSSDGSGNASNATPVVEWADGFCTAVATWKSDLKTTGQDLVASPSKDGLRQAADSVKNANQKLANDLHSLGTPDTESGQKVKQSVDDLSTTMSTELTKIEDTVQNASGISGLVSAASTISASLTAMSTALSNTFQTIDDADVKGDMKAGFDQATACNGIVGSGG